MGLYIHAVEGVMDTPRHATEVTILFDQVNLEALLSHVQRTGHTGKAATDHHRGLIDRQFELL